MFLDGVERAVSIADGSNNGAWFADMTGANAQSVTLGALVLGDDVVSQFPGTIDEVAYYARALTPQEISDHYDAGVDDYARIGIVEAGDSAALFALTLVSSTISATDGADAAAISALAAELVSIDASEGVDSASVSAALVNVAGISASESGDAAAVEARATWWKLATRAGTRTIYRLTLFADGVDSIELPMSSWQATVQSGVKSYLQAVVPISDPAFYSSIIARQGGSFLVEKCAVFQNTELRQSMAQAPLSSIRYDRGPTNASATISGYWSESAAGAGVVTLAGVRTVSVTSTVRVRSDIDWTLRPGQIANADGQTINPVRYINFYVNATDEYMDVGS